ncbi:MAG: hypothetical protein BMS9Abin26_0740 [Gammaproteobacteria bacterium]|nr:MAG: hypothetical protein BMS9Abin26_0740 [Gammaproteobacteria bacterium]
MKQPKRDQGVNGNIKAGLSGNVIEFPLNTDNSYTDHRHTDNSDERYTDGLKIAVGLLARREHSRLEIRRKLSSRGIEDGVISRILDVLLQRGDLDERRFVETYVHYRRQKGYGPRRIQMELQQRGVGDELLGDYLDERDEHWQQLALQVILKKFGAAPAESVKDKAKQMNFLQYRGFTMPQINKLFRDDTFI